jgi:hypothetical protein
MPDFATHPEGAPRDWGAAFAALPPEAPPADGWARVAARLPARRSRWPLHLATAAALLLAVALPWRLVNQQAGDAPSAPDAAATAPALASLHAESARLEYVLQLARDETVSSGAAAAMAGELDARLAAIDAELRQPGLAHARQLDLWRERVQALQSIVSFESTRRWLAAQGEGYDDALVQVD